MTNGLVFVSGLKFHCGGGRPTERTFWVITHCPVASGAPWRGY